MQKGGVKLDKKMTTHMEQVPRLNRIEGQVRGVKKMIEDGRYCVDILIQLKSVSNALARVQENIFRHHLESCVKDSLTGSNQKDKEKKVEEVIDLLGKFR